MIFMPLFNLIKTLTLASGKARDGSITVQQAGLPVAMMPPGGNTAVFLLSRYVGRTALVLLLLMGSTVATAGNLYRWVDSTGTVQYTDQPPPASAKNVQEKNFSGNVIENDALPYAARIAAKRYPVVLFVTNCGANCDQARALLKKRGIPYTAKNPESKADAEELKKLVGVMEVPVLVVGKTHLKGFEADGWNDALDTAGYPKAASGKNAAPKSPDDKAPAAIQ